MEEKEKDLWYAQVASLCESKAEEFGLLGYENVGPKDIWECVTSSYKQMPPLHQMVNDILSLKPNKYMNYLMLQMYKNS
ncbi:post-transcriptional regulator [Brevibacillus ruminantium]|uniref:Post-transcriptional regulator n=1 Tax=Brevibacillus ruminantium TaxID=2950604 RepID=A0ABY4WBG0_9BACL|nr:post-transcriptional regulator [Brevibacillus ruminantium]USG64094.1 post-transcriptional regulator [Brevibacillus ruminantium]